MPHYQFLNIHLLMRLFQGIVPLGIAYKRVPKSSYLTLDSFFLFDKKVNFINIIILLMIK
jgi:hypothetical protein